MIHLLDQESLDYDERQRLSTEVEDMIQNNNNEEILVVIVTNLCQAVTAMEDFNHQFSLILFCQSVKQMKVLTHLSEDLVLDVLAALNYLSELGISGTLSTTKFSKIKIFCL